MILFINNSLDSFIKVSEYGNTHCFNLIYKDKVNCLRKGFFFLFNYFDKVVFLHMNFVI